MAPTLLKSIPIGPLVVKIRESEVEDLVWFHATVETGDEELVVRGSDGLRWFSTPDRAESAALEVVEGIVQQAEASRAWDAMIDAVGFRSVLKPATR